MPAEIAEVRHRDMRISIVRSIHQASVNEAVRYAWKINKQRAERAEVILATCSGEIVGESCPTQ